MRVKAIEDDPHASSSKLPARVPSGQAALRASKLSSSRLFETLSYPLNCSLTPVSDRMMPSSPFSGEDNLLFRGEDDARPDSPSATAFEMHPRILPSQRGVVGDMGVRHDVRDDMTRSYASSSAAFVPVSPPSDSIASFRDSTSSPLLPRHPSSLSYDPQTQGWSTSSSIGVAYHSESLEGLGCYAQLAPRHTPPEGFFVGYPATPSISPDSPEFSFTPKGASSQAGLPFLSRLQHLTESPLQSYRSAQHQWPSLLGRQEAARESTSDSSDQKPAEPQAHPQSIHGVIPSTQTIGTSSSGSKREASEADLGEGPSEGPDVRPNKKRNKGKAPKTEEQKARRRQQNRNAQRNFKAKKHAYLQNVSSARFHHRVDDSDGVLFIQLEAGIADSQSRFDQITAENEALMQYAEQLQRENAQLRRSAQQHGHSDVGGIPMDPAQTLQQSAVQPRPPFDFYSEIEEPSFVASAHPPLTSMLRHSSLGQPRTSFPFSSTVSPAHTRFNPLERPSDALHRLSASSVVQPQRDLPMSRAPSSSDAPLSGRTGGQVSSAKRYTTASERVVGADSGTQLPYLSTVSGSSDALGRLQHPRVDGEHKEILSRETEPHMVTSSAGTSTRERSLGLHPSEGGVTAILPSLDQSYQMQPPVLFPAVRGVGQHLDRSLTRGHGATTLSNVGRNYPLTTEPPPWTNFLQQLYSTRYPSERLSASQTAQQRSTMSQSPMQSSAVAEEPLSSLVDSRTHSISSVPADLPLFSLPETSPRKASDVSEDSDGTGSAESLLTSQMEFSKQLGVDSSTPSG
jgi:hypothetical protein